MDPELGLEGLESMQGLEGLSALNINISPSALIAGLVFSVVGIVLFKRGRKQLNYVWVSVGIAMMVYPLFIWQALPAWGVGIALSLVAYYYR